MHWIESVQFSSLSSWLKANIQHSNQQKVRLSTQDEPHLLRNTNEVWYPYDSYREKKNACFDPGTKSQWQEEEAAKNLPPPESSERCRGQASVTQMDSS